MIHSRSFRLFLVSILFFNSFPVALAQGGGSTTDTAVQCAVPVPESESLFQKISSCIYNNPKPVIGVGLCTCGFFAYVGIMKYLQHRENILSMNSIKRQPEKPLDGCYAPEVEKVIGRKIKLFKNGYNHKGLLLHGLPGTGKTHLAKMIAEKAGAYEHLVHCTDTDVRGNTFIHSDAQAMDALYKELIEKAQEQKVVLILDEVAAIAVSKELNEHSAVDVLVGFLNRLEQEKNILVVGTTYEFDRISTVIKDRRLMSIEIDLPQTVEGREKLLTHLVENKGWKVNKDEIFDAEYNIAPEIFKQLAKKTNGFTGDQLRQLLEDSIEAQIDEQGYFDDPAEEIFLLDAHEERHLPIITLAEEDFEDSINKIKDSINREKKTFFQKLCTRENFAILVSAVGIVATIYNMYSAHNSHQAQHASMVAQQESFCAQQERWALEDERYAEAQKKTGWGFNRESARDAGVVMGGVAALGTAIGKAIDWCYKNPEAAKDLLEKLKDLLPS